MKSSTGWLVVLLLAVGCGSPDSGKVSQLPTDGAPEAVNQSLPASPIVGTLQLPEANDSLTGEIERLSRAAYAAQAAGEFGQEAGHWEEAHRLLQEQFGLQSWQATNATLAVQTARRHAALDGRQRSQLSELMEWQNRIAELLQRGNPQAALTMALGSIERTLELYGENSYMHGKQLVQIGRLEQLAGRFDEAIETYRQAFATISPWLGRVHPELEAIHAHLGETWLAKGDQRQAVENLRVALRMAGELYGANSLHVATRANDLAVALQRCGTPQDALPYLVKAVEIRRSWLGPEHPHVAHCMLNIGTCYIDLQQYEAAVQHLENALTILTNTVQGPNRLVVDCLHKLSVSWMLLDKPDRAEVYLQQLVVLLRQTDVSNVELGLAEYRWGVSLAKQGKYSDAEPLLKLSLARLENVLGIHHPQVTKPREALSQLYIATDRAADAQALQSRVQPVSYETDEPRFVRDPHLQR